VIELGSRVRKHAPPAHILWQTLTSPRREGPRAWLHLTPDEMSPRILESKEPTLVVWSSLWPTRPDDVLRFEIDTDGRSGSRLRWVLLSPDELPDPPTLGRMRYRINFLIDGEMRASFGQ
jgi:hypothetical protein